MGRVVPRAAYAVAAHYLHTWHATTFAEEHPQSMAPQGTSEHWRLRAPASLGARPKQLANRQHERPTVYTVRPGSTAPSRPGPSSWWSRDVGGSVPGGFRDRSPRREARIQPHGSFFDLPQHLVLKSPFDIAYGYL